MFYILNCGMQRLKNIALAFVILTMLILIHNEKKND